MSVDVESLFNELVSLASQSGLFTQVNGHEPASAASAGATTGIWLQDITPPKKLSGLSASAVRVAFNQRLYMPIASTGNRDLIDPAMMTAAVTMIGLLSADFTLDGEVFAVDLLGAYGAPISGKAGYVDMGGTTYRIIDITIPLLLDAVFPQSGVPGG